MTGAQNAGGQGLLRYLPVLIWTAVVLTLSFLPLGGMHLPRIPGLDKVVHCVEFLVLSLLVGRAMALPRMRRLFLRVLVATPIMALLAGLTELLQRWIPGRSAEVLDLVADVTGILLGMVVTALVVAINNRSTVAG